MENKNKYLIITFIFVALVIITGTFAWLSYRSKKTSLVFTVGDMNNMQVTLKPYQIDAIIDPELDYTDVEYTEVTAINNRNVKMNYTLFYDIEEIDSALQSTDFKYTVERSTNNGSTYTVYKTGNFSTANTTNDFIILDEDVPANTTYKYKVYVWVDGGTNPNTGIEGATFKGELRAEILGEAKAYLVDTSGTDTYYKESAYLTKIVNVSFVDYINTTNAVKTYNMGLNSNRPVTAWLEAATEPDTYNLYIGSNYKIYGTILKETFRGMTNLTNISFTNLDTSEATDMYGMFSNCETITTLDVSSFDTSNVTTMRAMFANCYALTSLNLSNFNTSNVTNMRQMFLHCYSLTSLNLSSLNTTKVTSMRSMFSGCTGLSVLNLSNFDTSNVTDMYGMFMSTSTLGEMQLTKIIGIENFNTSKVEDMSIMFQYCTHLTTLNLSSWDTSNVTLMSFMFDNCYNLVSLNLSGFDTSKVTKMDSMFERCSSLTQIDLSSFNTTLVTDMNNMFYKCSNLNTIYVSDRWNTNAVTDSTDMFKNDSNLPNFNSSVIDKTNAHYGEGGYLTYKAYTPPSNS